MTANIRHYYARHFLQAALTGVGDSPHGDVNRVLNALGNATLAVKMIASWIAEDFDSTSLTDHERNKVKAALDILERLKVKDV